MNADHETSTLPYARCGDQAGRWLRLFSKLSIGASSVALGVPVGYRFLLALRHLRLSDLWRTQGGRPAPVGETWVVQIGWITSHVGVLASLVLVLAGLGLLLASARHRDGRCGVMAGIVVVAAITSFYLSMEVGLVLAGL